MAAKKILVAPLNWGLGHATRCIPLIAALETLGAEVKMASDGESLQLLQEEFPHLESIELPSYGIQYRWRSMVRNLAEQAPRILWAIRSEHVAVRQLAKSSGQMDGIISDNRYGCWAAGVPSVIISHQLHVQVPVWGLKEATNAWIQRQLRKFDALWVPDVASEEHSLSGKLSHGSTPVHPNTQYLGILSRMQHYPDDREYDVAVVLSGPEPQRTRLENKLMEQATTLPQTFIFVQGKPQIKQKHYRIAENVEVVSFLTRHELNDILMASRLIVCRSGYSSIMDLAMLGKKAILIPTPGQTEQEYLAQYFSEKNIFLSRQQSEINLENDLLLVGQTKGIRTGMYSSQEFLPILQQWLENL